MYDCSCRIHAVLIRDSYIIHGRGVIVGHRCDAAEGGSVRGELPQVLQDDHDAPPIGQLVVEPGLLDITVKEQ